LRLRLRLPASESLCLTTSPLEASIGATSGLRLGDLIDAIGGVLCAIRSQDACSYFEHVGYHPIAQLQ
jgi:hypothetical protein